MRKQTWLKLGVGVVAIVVLPWLFLTSLQDTIAEPYELNGATLSGWTLVQSDPARRSLAVLGLRPPAMLVPNLFGQLFDRTMASMTSPAEPVLPIVLRSEFQSGLGAALSPDEMLQVARDAGLDQTRLDPVCMGVKRASFAGRSRELYFVLFDAPEVSAFREHLMALAQDPSGAGAPGSATFDLVLPVGGSDSAFTSWFPMTVNREVDCQAPLYDD